MAELDPQIVAEMLASGYDPQKLSEFQARRGMQPRQYQTLGASKAVPPNFLTDTLPKAAFGDPNATVRMPVTPGGDVQNPNLPPSAYEGTYGQQHPAIEAGAIGGMAATGAPELMAQSLLKPALAAGKAAVKAAPVATTAGLATAGALAPSGTGKTPWEVMNDQWESQRVPLRQQIADQRALIEAENAKLNVSPADTARLNKLKEELVPLEAKAAGYAKQKQTGNHVDKNQGQIDARKAAIADLEGRGGAGKQREISAPVISAAENKIKEYEDKIAGIDADVLKSQTPFRQAHPLASAASFPVMWGANYGTGMLAGKVAKAVEQSRLGKMENLIGRAENYAKANTAVKTGAAKKEFYSPKSPEGVALKQELNAVKQPRVGYVPKTYGTAATFGGFKGSMIPIGATAIDAQTAPPGSPLSQASGFEALKSPSFWGAASPEILMGAALSAAGAKKGMGAKVELPYDRVNAHKFVANNVAPWPVPAPRTPKKAKVEVQAAPAIAAPKKGKGKAKTPIDIPDL